MKRIIALFVVCFIFVSTLFCVCANAEIYPDTFLITNLNYTTDIITLESANGFIWEYEGIEDLFIGDMASVLMDDNNTENITDDIILKLTYSGWYVE